MAISSVVTSKLTKPKSLLAFSFVFICACSHPIEIVGEGDVLSATGSRNCYLEDFRTGSEKCTKNLVVTEYNETYSAVARDGWKFEKWGNYCDEATNNKCSFNYSADAVKASWGATALPLVAVFSEVGAPPPQPEAIYSYQLDGAGKLVNPQALKNAVLQRKVAYFSFTGEHSQINFWCCKIPGREDHKPRVIDAVAPYILQVNLATLPQDNGLSRELYADLFESKNVYKGYVTAWKLERLVNPNRPPVARAGDDKSVTVGLGVNLNGSRSTDDDGDMLIYIWSLERPTRSTATLSAADTSTPSFIADQPGSYKATLTVSDGELKDTDSVTITANAKINEPPRALAAASPQDAIIGNTIRLSAAGSSDPEGQTLSYSWTLVRPDGSVAVLSGITLRDPNFQVDVAGTYTATLGVNDGTHSSAPASVTVTAKAPPIDGAQLIRANCLSSSCHTMSALQAKRPTAFTISNAINSGIPRMNTTDLKELNAAKIQAIATALQ